MATDDSSRRAPTLYDVARDAGVSHQTVSRVVAGAPTVGAEVRRRVQHSIDELGYRPNLTARSLATRRSQRLGALVYELLAAGPSRVVQGAVSRAREAGYTLDIVTLDPDDAGGIATAIELMTQAQVAGVLAFTPTDGVVEALAATRFSVPVSLEYEVHGYLVDGRASMGGSGMELLVEHLAGLGHRTFALLGGQKGWLAARGRSEAYRRALSARGLDSALEWECGWTPESGYEGGMRLPLDRGVTAVIAANDHVAIGAMAALAERGVRVPEEMSVVGFDDTPESPYQRPALTTVRLAFREQGRLAVETLLGMIEGDGAGADAGGRRATEIRNAAAARWPGEVGELDQPELIVRASTARARES